MALFCKAEVPNKREYGGNGELDLLVEKPVTIGRSKPSARMAEASCQPGEATAHFERKQHD